MKNFRALSMLLVATIAGIAAVAFASRWITQAAGNGVTKVAVAAIDANLGQRLGPDFIKMVDWPIDSQPPGAFHEPALLDGRVLKTSVLRGEPLIDAKLTPIGTKGGLSAVIAEGKRAITVRVNDVVGVAGFALPGSFVDILVNTQQDNAKPQTSQTDQAISKIVLEKILVLAVAQEVNRDDTKPRVVNAVTLEVTPEEAEKLDLARSVGQLSLVLRNQVEASPVDTNGATKITLLKEPAVATPTPPAPKTRVVRQLVSKAPSNCVSVIVGTQRGQECF